MNKGVTTVASTDDYTVEKELVLAADMHRQPVDPKLVKAAGFVDENTPPEQLLLVQVMISGSRYGDQWLVNAWIGEGNSQDDIVGSIWCKPGTSRDDVLKVADTWIRHSEHITFVPGGVHEIAPSTPDEIPYFVFGVVLARGDKF